MAEATFTTKTEIWKPVTGWEDYYSVSNLGRVRSNDRMVSHLTRWGRQGTRLVRGRVLSQTNFAGRYWQVSLKSEGHRITAYVHRLVCQAFHGSPPLEQPEVAHFDGDGHNNVSDNLRWASAAENSADRIRHKTTNLGERSPTSKLTEKGVRAIRAANDRTRDQEFAMKFNVGAKRVALARTGVIWGWVQ